MERLESHFEIAELISRFLEGKLSHDESERLKRWREESDANRQLWRRLTDPGYLEDHLQYWKTQDEAGEYPERRKTKITGKGNRRKMLKYAAIGLILLTAGFAGRHLFDRPAPPGAQNEEVAGLQQVQIMPRGKVAQLVLGNGKIVELNDNPGTTLTEKDGTKVHNGGKRLYYTPTGKNDHEEVYNTLIVPRGGEYQVTLSDGTKVWLNAASSLKYPTQFEGKERKVLLTGEGYFEVAKDGQHPFVVETGKTDITVLGTKFNISAYADDPEQKITLAEGAVRVNEADGVNGKKDVLLEPGYAALIRKNGHNIHVKKADMEAVLAWKNGMFIFDGESLGSLMRKLSRWYNVDVKYDDGVDTLFHFTGRIQRYENISGILHLIELTGKVRFSVKENEVEIMPVRR